MSWREPSAVLLWVAGNQTTREGLVDVLGLELEVAIGGSHSSVVRGEGRGALYHDRRNL